MKLGIIAASLAALALGGCATTWVEDHNGDKLRTVHDVGRALNGPPLVMPPDLAARFALEPIGSTPDARGVALRHEAIDALLQTSNTNCYDYMVGVGAGRNTYGVGLSVLGSLFSTVGGLVSKGPAANAFSAASNFSQGTSNTLSQTLFGGREFPLLFSAVMAGRRGEEGALLARKRAGEFNAYSPSSILTLVQSYDRLCGINYGVERLTTLAQTTPQITSPSPPPAPPQPPLPGTS